MTTKNTGMLGSTSPTIEDHSNDGINSGATTYGVGEGVDGGIQSSSIESGSLLASDSYIYQGETLKVTDLKSVFHFPYDSSRLSQDDMEELIKHSEYLKQHPELLARIEGHADQRGTREYNIALGERRGKAAYLIMNSDSAEVISYGEEKPISLIRNEEGYRLNRRIEIKYETIQ